MPNDITDYILSKTNLLTRYPEFTAGKEDWSAFNSGGVEIEVAEFLYSIVRMVKPNFILETGTHLGVSSTYMARGCQMNKKGKVWTYEVIPELLNKALALWRQVGVSDFISSNLIPSLSATLPLNTKIDILFLDSEPQLRFDEFNKFWEFLNPHGLVIIHDLHETMGLHKETYHGVYSWPYGDFRPKLGGYLDRRDVQFFHFGTPRGLTIFQRTDCSDANMKYLDRKD